MADAPLEEIADELGYDVGRMTAPWGVAESGRFIEAGVPAVWFWQPDDFYYHSIHDTVDKLDGNALKAVARHHGDRPSGGLRTPTSCRTRRLTREDAAMAAEEVNHER